LPSTVAAGGIADIDLDQHCYEQKMGARKWNDRPITG